jgi:molybdenum cofactor biosynthesis enzyme MoaA
VEAAVIVTYRCNARCQMCNIWQHPTKAEEEFPPELLEKLPGGLRSINITGGEPALRKDLPEIVDILTRKTRRVEISTNGSFTDRLVEAARQHPEITVRISVEGLPETTTGCAGSRTASITRCAAIFACARSG